MAKEDQQERYLKSKLAKSTHGKTSECLQFFYLASERFEQDVPGDAIIDERERSTGSGKSQKSLRSREAPRCTHKVADLSRSVTTQRQHDVCGHVRNRQHHKDANVPRSTKPH